MADDLECVVCGYCRMMITRDEQIQHDITFHAGLERVRSDHQMLCNRIGFCLCRVEDYERVAKEMSCEAAKGSGEGLAPEGN